ncbi:MAG: class I adenylate-forming enzyme family protein [Actinomycetota bacterium]
MTDTSAIDTLQAVWGQLTAPGAQFAWSEQEVRGMTMRVFDAAPPDMRFIWELSAGYADQPYLVFEDETLTYAEAHAVVRRLAQVLAEDHGVGRGDRVAIAMRNYPEWVLAYWATVCLGAAVVGVNAWWTSAELEYGLGDSRPRVIIADDERVERLLPILDGLRAEGPLSLITVRSDGELPADAVRWSDVIDAAEAPDALPPVEIDPDDDVCIFYTSGTTGFPKGAQLTHRGSVHNLMHCAFAAAASAAATALVAGEEPDPTPPTPTIMAPTPLFHVTANNCLLHPGTLTGAKMVFLHRWDAGRALELIEREAVTTFSAVPTMSRELLAHPDWDKRDVSSLATMGGGGAAVQPDLVDKINAADGEKAATTGYGLTETHGIITAVGHAFFQARPSSVGPVMPTVEAKVVDPVGDEVPPGERGELCVKGPIVIKGYLNKPKATAEAIVDGWFRTGDIVYLDEDGFVHIVDRAKDMVLRGGENIYCAEVEAAVYEHPSVAETVVFGVPDERLGETVGVAIHLAEDTTLTEEELRAHLQPLLAKYKIPEHVWFRPDPLPQNASGKFLKRTVRDELLAAD